MPLPIPQPERSYRGTGERLIVHSDDGLTTALDRVDGAIVGWRATAFSAPEEGWRTLPWMLPVWYLDQGVQVVHAGLVGRDGVGVLIVGEGGSGKSTTCLAAATAGLEFLGDDFVGIEEDGNGWIGHSLSCTSRTTLDTLERHPEIAGGLQVGESEGKNIVFLGAEATRPSIPVAGILMPRLSVERTARSPASGTSGRDRVPADLARPGGRARAGAHGAARAAGPQPAGAVAGRERLAAGGRRGGPTGTRRARSSMRLLVWSDGFWPRIGGVEVLGANFVTAMRDRGHELLVIANRDHSNIAERGEIDGVPVVRIDVRDALEQQDVRVLAASRATATRERDAFAPDVDHIFFGGPDLMISAAARARRPAPVVFSLHLTPMDEMLAPDHFYGRELRAADRVTACSEATLAEVEAQTGKLDRASVILNALPPVRGIEPAPPPESPVLLSWAASPTRRASTSVSRRSPRCGSRAHRCGRSSRATATRWRAFACARPSWESPTRSSSRAGSSRPTCPP